MAASSPTEDHSLGKRQHASRPTMFLACNRRAVIFLLVVCFVSAFVLYDGVYFFSPNGTLLYTIPLPARPTVATGNTTSTATWAEVPSSESSRVRYNLTIVTAFLDIGQFGKGTPGNKRDHRIYEKWSSAYRLVHSPIVFYTDSPAFGRHIQHVRRHLPDLTRVVHVNRSQLWSFQQKDKIAAIYKAGYPKHWPNTVYPDYTCVTHTKFELVEDAILKGYYLSDHVVWMDAGYLRDKAGEAANRSSSMYYVMEPPADFDPTRVMCGEIYQPNFNRGWRGIFRGNINWVGGGFFLGRVDLMLKFVRQYTKAVGLFLELHESNVEQQVIYAMYTKEGRTIVHPEVELQAVRGGWFTLGLRCLVPH
ncbi:hypothetical protein BaRGS_00003024, partial [Batillaria attramentaria]